VYNLKIKRFNSQKGCLRSTCANAQNSPRGQYPVCTMSLHFVLL